MHAYCNITLHCCIHRMHGIMVDLPKLCTISNVIYCQSGNKITKILHSPVNMVCVQCVVTSHNVFLLGTFFHNRFFWLHCAPIWTLSHVRHVDVVSGVMTNSMWAAYISKSVQRQKRPYFSIYVQHYCLSHHQMDIVLPVGQWTPAWLCCSQHNNQAQIQCRKQISDYDDVPLLLLHPHPTRRSCQQMGNRNPHIQACEVNSSDLG
jgi:hypothetical protein